MGSAFLVWLQQYRVNLQGTCCSHLGSASCCHLSLALHQRLGLHTRFSRIDRVFPGQ